MRLVIAGRGSKLALAQSHFIGELLQRVHSGLDVEIRAVVTTGDKDSRPFAAIGGRGLFVAEVEREVAEGRADVAVHSAKDLTAELAEGCLLVCVPARATVHDVVVGGSGATGEERLTNLPLAATVGTSSMRRRALLAEMRPDLEVVPLRGNLDTRLRKVRDGAVDAAVLAAAGIDRLGLAEAVDPAPLDPAWWVPPPGQGALAVEALAARDDLRELFAPVEDAAARAEVTLERAFAGRLEGGCSVPLGCLARFAGHELVASGYLGHPHGGEFRRDRVSGRARDAAALGIELAEAMLQAGGDELLADLHAAAAAGPEVEAP